MSLRYSIYKVQSLKRYRRSSLILSQLFSFVKNFFQVFSNFFELIRFSCLLSPRGDSSILSHPFPFVKNFFQVFSNFFRIFSFARPLADSLRILAYHLHFVNTFFPLFLIFLIFRMQSCIPAFFFSYPATQNPSGAGPRGQITHIQAAQRSQVNHQHRHQSQDPPSS